MTAATPTYCMEGNEINAGGKGPNWTKAYKAINSYASTIFRSHPYHLLGLQHLTNRDQDWARQQGHNAATPRTGAWAREDIVAGMNQAQSAAARDNNIGADAYAEKTLALFDYSLTVLGTTICERLAELNPIGTGVINMTILQIVNHLDLTEGVASSMDYGQLKASFETPIHWDGTMGSFDKHCSDGTRALADLERLGNPINREDQLASARLSLSHFAHLKAGCDQYAILSLIPGVGGALPAPTRMLLLQTVRAYISANPTPLSGQQVVFHAADAPIVSDSSSGLLAAITDLNAHLAAAATRASFAAGGGGRGRGDRGRAGRGYPRANARGDTRTAPAMASRYCYLHGLCNHYGFKCKAMLADPSKYNDSMLAAWNAKAVPGGAP